MERASARLTASQQERNKLVAARSRSSTRSKEERATDHRQRRFGFLLRAFEYGAPPHAGVAYGIDRLVALLMGLDSIRDTIAFPKTQKGSCLMTDAPSAVDKKQLAELGIMVVASPGRKTEVS